MIKAIIDNEAVGNYAVAVRISETLYFIPIVISSSLFPAIIKAKQIESNFYYGRLQKLYDFMVWIGVAIALPITFSADRLINILFCNEFVMAADILRIHICACVFVFLGVASTKWFIIEYIIIDGGSTDGTLDIIKKYEKKISTWISEEDKNLYDAMNKGLRFATDDVIAFLNAVDIYMDHTVIENVIDTMSEHQVDAVFGDLVIVAPHNLKRVIRYYESRSFNADMIARGCMPAHPTLFLRKSVFEKYGYFKIDYEIAADFEFIARIFGQGDISYYYLPKVLVRMRKGGISTKSLKSNWILNKEILRACKENGIRTNVFKIFLKYPRKILGMTKSI